MTEYREVRSMGGSAPGSPTRPAGARLWDPRGDALMHYYLPLTVFRSKDHRSPHSVRGDLRRMHSVCVCATSSAGTPTNTEQERSREELLWLFASTKMP